MRGSRSSLSVGLGVAVVVALSGCAIRYYYSPGVYEVAAGKVTPFTGPLDPVELVDVQPQDVERSYEFFQAGITVWRSDRRQVTEALITQLGDELRKAGGQVASNAAKQIDVAVPAYSAQQGMWAFKVDMTVVLTLGDAPPRTMTIENTSPGNMWRAMNGVIARAVIAILNDPEVRGFLAAG